MAIIQVSAAVLNFAYREVAMRIDNWHGYDDWLTKDLPDDEPLTDDEIREQREAEHDARLVQRLFE